jgi:hypothetical protein
MKLIKLLKDIGKLIAGTHFLTAYGNKRGGKRKKYPTAESFKKEIWASEETKAQEADVCEHGRGMTDYCQPCGRVNGGG